MKDSNKDERSSAESLEGRPRAKENDPSPHTVRAQQRAAVSLTQIGTQIGDDRSVRRQIGDKTTDR
jgi:hypothetical protein